MFEPKLAHCTSERYIDISTREPPSERPETMRSFNEVTEATRCTTCGAEIQPPADDGAYHKQTVVTYTDCTEQFPYCSNRCVNADAERSAAVAEAQSHLSAHLEADVLNEIFDAHTEALTMNAEQGAEAMDRTEISRALAKAMAYKQCGKQELAEEWARKLVTLLECADILRTES